MLHPLQQRAKTWFKAQTRQTQGLLIFALLLAGWMFSDLLNFTTTPPKKAPTLPVVSTQHSTAAPLKKHLTLQGQTKAAQIATLKGQTTGVVAKIHAPQGSFVKEGALLLSLSPEDKPAKEQKAAAALDHKVLELKAAQKLGQQGFQAKNKVAEAAAALAAAQADLAAAQTALAHTKITAPFNGVFEQHFVDVGTTIREGDTLAILINLNPLKAVAYAPQDQVHALTIGSEVEVTFPSGEKTLGTLTYIARQAQLETRTFMVEVTLPNPEKSHFAGSSVTLHLPTGSVPAHFLSPAFLALSEKGVLGIKVLGPGNKTQFMPVTLEESTPKGVWVSGLPTEVTFVTLGHNFVQDGQEVTPAEEVPQTPPQNTTPNTAGAAHE